MKFTSLIFFLCFHYFVKAQIISIPQIQGKTANSPFASQIVTTEGIVTKDLQKGIEQKGFFIQSLITDYDSLTSDGIFIFDSLSNFEVKKGDLVRITGKIVEKSSQTTISQIQDITILDSNVALPLPAILHFPIPRPAYLERREGMLVTVFNMVVTETYDLGRYGEIVLSHESPLIQPTEIIDPNDFDPADTTYNGTSNMVSVKAKEAENNLRKIILADDLGIANPDPIPFIDPLEKTIRIGTRVDTLSGILSYAHGNFRIYPIDTPRFLYATRPPAPAFPASNLTVATFNLLNFFNGNGKGGGFPNSRGAKTLIEFERQKSKIVPALRGLNADIVSLMEVENDGDGPLSAIKALIDTLNAGLSFHEYYSFIEDPTNLNGNPGTDEIKVALIYKREKVTPYGLSKACNSLSFQNLGRPPLAQTFAHNLSGAKFTIVVNHFKSKSCTNADSMDLDQKDGQSCFNETRKRQAQELFTFVQSLISESAEEDVLALGDFNAYTEEDPMDLLKAKGMVDLVNGYSYTYDGLRGSLDHILATPSIAKKFTGGIKWQINSTEPLVIDYTTSFKTQDLFKPNPYRSSDHDPVIASFFFEPIHLGWEHGNVEKERMVISPNPSSNGDMVKINTIDDIKVLDARGVQIYQGSPSLLLQPPAGIYIILTPDHRSIKWIVKD